MDFDKSIFDSLLHLGLLEIPQLDLDGCSMPPSDDRDKKMRMMMYLVSQPIRNPIPKYREIRRNGAWQEHVTKCLYKRGEFQQRYHMTIAAFRMLVHYLDIQEVDYKQSPCSPVVGLKQLIPTLLLLVVFNGLGGVSQDKCRCLPCIHCLIKTSCCTLY